MEKMVFRYMDTIPDHTIKTIDEMPKKTADKIPSDYRNNIR
ncbi:hypothetical protein ACDX78_15290 [Virgibacillus oceani]